MAIGFNFHGATEFPKLVPMLPLKSEYCTFSSRPFVLLRASLLYRDILVFSAFDQTRF